MTRDDLVMHSLQPLRFPVVKLPLRNDSTLDLKIYVKLLIQ